MMHNMYEIVLYKYTKRALFIHITLATLKMTLMTRLIWVYSYT